MSEGYNWRQTLAHFAAISGALAGFCVTFIALILGGPVADIEICTTGVTFGQTAVLLFGIATALFICSAELFLLSKSFDTFDLSNQYQQFLKENIVGKTKEEWERFEDEQKERCRHNEKLARNCYNFAVFIIFGGLFLAIAPYNIIIAVIVAGLGILLEAWQMLR